MDRYLDVVLVNPLGAALKHYTSSLERLLADCGAEVTSVTLPEPSLSGHSRTLWLAGYVKLLVGIKRKNPRARVIQTWPVLGYWDFVIVKCILRRGTTSVIFHDPEPLVRAIGYGRLARRIASIPFIHSSAIVHSPTAADVIDKQTKLPHVVEVLHPMQTPHQALAVMGVQRNIRVLGQYKVDRDVIGLKRLAENASPDWRLQIIGRGWPPIAGWHIKNEFVAEAHFDELVRTSHAILIPYSRFFQSGVAIRALEWGVPVVGPYASSLQIALGDDCRWLVRDGDWTSAVVAAINEDRDQVSSRARDLYDRVVKDWSNMLEEMFLV